MSVSPFCDINSAHPRKGEAYAQVRTQSGKSFLAYWNRPKLFLQTRSKPASHLRAFDCKFKMSGISPTLGRGKRMRRQAGTQSEKSSLACQNRPKLFLQPRSKPASHLRALDHKFKISGISLTLGRGKRRQKGTQTGKSSLACQNRPKLVLQNPSKPASQLRALNWAKKAYRDFFNPRAEEAHTQAGPQSVKILLACQNRPKPVLQTSSKPASHLRALDQPRKVSGILSTLGGREHMRSQGPRVRKFYFLARISPKKDLQTYSKPASHLHALDQQKKCLKIRQTQVGGSAYAGRAPKCQNFAGFLESAQSCSADSQQACESFARVRSARKRVLGFLSTLSRRERMRKQSPKMSKFYWLVRIGPDLFCSLPASLRVICTRYIGQKKVSEFLSTLERSQRVHRQGPKVSKFYQLARIGPNLFCRLPASLRVIWVRQIGKKMCREFRQFQVGGSACAGSAPEC